MDLIELSLVLAAHPLIDKFLSGLYVALGLGLVIFFHELGHFAVAKWCDVHVERFSIGFGPLLWSWKRGETEYALSLIPFGGYVKMLGQDDMDPSQLSSEEIAEDPRSYSAKSVPQRMGIISAGVIMNVITGMIFFAVAFGLGVQSAPSVLGSVVAGQPAWVAGLENGDRVTGIKSEGNDDFRDMATFGDIKRGVALTSGTVTIRGTHADGRQFEITVRPDPTGSMRTIGAMPPYAGLTVMQTTGARTIPVAETATPAAAAEPSFQPGDRIRRVDDVELKDGDWPQLLQYLARHRNEAIDLHIQRARARPDDLVKITLPPQPFHTLGLWMDIGRITAVQTGSPAERIGLQKGDRITHVDGREVGKEIDPLWLPDYLWRKADTPVQLEISRPVQGKAPEVLSLSVTPNDEPGWVEQPVFPTTPLSAPALGITYQVLPAVMHVEPGSPAEGKIALGEQVRRMRLVLPEGITDLYAQLADNRDPITLKFASADDKEAIQDWAHAFWRMQATPARQVELTVADKKGKERTVTLTPRPAQVQSDDGEAEDWNIPIQQTTNLTLVRGLITEPMLITQQASGPLDAMAMGLDHTRNTAADIYLTLRGLLFGLISPKNLHGPISIATAAFQIAQNGLAELLLFLGLLSVNLAVLNFLPIPVLDGGHMVFLIWEGVTRRKPSERIVATATYAGLAFVLGLMLFVLYLDIFVHGMRG